MVGVARNVRALGGASATGQARLLVLPLSLKGL